MIKKFINLILKWNKKMNYNDAYTLAWNKYQDKKKQYWKEYHTSSVVLSLYPCNPTIEQLNKLYSIYSLKCNEAYIVYCKEKQKAWNNLISKK